MKLQGLYFACQIQGLDKLTQATIDVTEFELEEGLSELFSLTVTLVSPHSDIDINKLVLSRATLTVFSDGLKQREISGVITRVRQGETGFQRTYYTLIIRPALWLLTQRQHSRI